MRGRGPGSSACGVALRAILACGLLSVWALAADVAVEDALPDAELEAAQTLFDAGDYAGARRAVEPLVAARERMLGEDAPATIAARVLLGETLRAEGDATAAIALHRASHAARERLLGAGHPETLDVLEKLAIAHDDAGASDVALPIYQRVVELRTRALGADHPDTLIARSNVASAYELLGRTADSLAVLEDVLRIQRGVADPDREHLLVTLSNIAYVYESAGRMPESLAAHREANALALELYGPRHPERLHNLSNMAAMLDTLGRYAESQPMHDEAFRLRSEVLGAEHPDTLITLNNLAFNLQQLGRHADALPLYERVAAGMQRIHGERHWQTVTALSNVASTLEALDRFDEAVATGRRAATLASAAWGVDHPLTAHARYDVGLALKHMGRPREALPELEAAAQAFRASQGPVARQTLRADGARASVYEAVGRVDDARALFETTLAGQRRALGERHPDVLDTLGDLADLELRAGTAAAIGHYAAFVEGVERVRADGDLATENRQALFGRWVPRYKRYARALALADRANAAFRISELSRARTLLETTALRQAADAAVARPEDRTRLEELEARLAGASQRLARAETAERLARESERDARARELAAFQRELALRYPAFAKLQEVAPAEPADAARLLPRDAVFLSYLISDQRLLVFVLSRDAKLEARDLGTVPGLTDSVDALRRLLSHPEGARELLRDGLRVWALADGGFQVRAGPAPQGARWLRDPAEIAEALGKRLLEPLRDVLDRHARLLIAPDGVLAVLPFEALTLDDAPLIATHEVGYAQSLSMYALLQRRIGEYRRDKTRKSLLALGGAPYGASAGSTLTGEVARAYDLRGLRWTELPASADEARSAAKVFGEKRSRLMLGEDAAEARLLALDRSGELAKYRYLLFSAHGYLNLEEPALSAVVLRQTGLEPGTDGYVTAAEWSRYTLKSDLTVLSACETGVGRVVHGEGVVGLPYALYVAGNAGTLLSLWPVADESTARFMAAFFTRLARGMDAVRALSETKRELVEAAGAESTGYYWAGFVLYGT